jgi:hypothetical protein
MKILAAAAFALFAFSALADEPPKMSKEAQAMMEKFMKAATPGPEHQAMAKMAGKWKLQTTMWTKKGAPPMKSEGTAEFTSILGGRYLQQEVHGSMGEGQPFEGRGIDAYDNVTKTRQSVWVDNMGTGLMVMKGKCALAAKSCTMNGKVADVMLGKDVPVSSTVTVKDDNTFIFEMTGPGPDGKGFKSLEIVYTRQ